MIPVKKIMAALDLSQYSKATLRYASYLAQGLGAELIIVNVLNQRDVEAVARVAQYAPNISVKKYVEEQKTQRKAIIEELIKEVRHEGPGPEIVLKVGMPFTELLQIVKEKAIDIVVMGAKGRSDIATLVLGSTSEKMFRRCPVPVIVIKNKEL
jgi:nucleotide-binding universal stress UspA family protein